MRKMEVPRNTRPDRRPAGLTSGGFTIVELLAVMVIIGVLVSMVTAAAYLARIAAMQADINSEIGQLSDALKAYKEQFGEYPPDSNDPVLIRKHMLKAFKYAGPLPPEVQNLEPCKALLFWLGGVIGPDGLRIGFSANPKNPFDPTDKNRLGPFFDFDPQRITAKGQYCPKGFNVSDEVSAYNYFRAERGSYQGKTSCCGTAPYLNTNSETNDWVNPDTFQIHSPGLDGVYGSGTQYPSGEDYEDADFDDQTNFSGGPLKNKMP